MSFSSATLLDLLRAGYHQNKGAIKWELHKGANPNIVHPNYGVSAMHLASGQGKEPTEILLQYGGDPNVVSLDGLTPLHVAASWGDYKVLQLLLKNGADSSVQDQDGQTAYDLAVDEGNMECAQLLKYLTAKQTVTDYRTSRHFDTRMNTPTNGTTCQIHAENNHTAHCLDTLNNVFQVPPQGHLDTITELIYKYMSEGKQVCCDVTSPNTPVIEIRTRAMHADNVDCVHHEHKTSHRYHRLQNGGMPSRCLSPESPRSSHRNNCRECMESHDYPSCCNAVSSNTDHHHQPQYQVPGSGHHNQLHCSHVSPQANRNNHAFNHSRTPSFAGNYRTPPSTLFCNELQYTTRCTPPACNCSTPQFITSPSSGLKSATSYCRETVSATSLPASVKGYTQHSTRIHSPEKTLTYTSAIKPKSRPYNDPQMKSYVPQGDRNLDACLSANSFRRPTNSPSLNRGVLPLAVSDVQVEEALNTESCSPNRISQNPNNDRTHFKSELYEDLTDSSTIGDFKIVNSKPPKSKSLPQDEIITPPENRKREIVKSDQTSGLALTTEKLFPPLQPESDDILGAAGNRKTGNDFPRDIKRSERKCKRRSLLKPPETVALLPKSQLRPHERVAEFILSVQEFITKSNYEDDGNGGLTGKSSLYTTRTEDNLGALDWLEQDSLCHTEQTLVGQHNKSGEKTYAASTSSVDTFATCDEGYSDAMTQENEAGKSSVQTTSAKQLKEVERANTCISIEKKRTEGSSSKWKSPTLVISDEDIMTSDDSYVNKMHGSVNRQIYKPSKLTEHWEGSKKQKNNALFKTPLSSEETVKRDNIVDIQPLQKRLSSDSLFSSASMQEYVYKDKKTNIMFIERHIPSEAGSSICRRSLESTVSRDTIDSQATLIYDWHALNEVLRAEQLSTQPHSLRREPHNHPCAQVHASSWSDATCPLNSDSQNSSSSPDNIQQSNESFTDDVDEIADDVVIPTRLKDMTCQEISQELQKYGELPGPVIPATRQAYLRRLTALGTNPGLVILSKNCPDYPHEMRQALNGQFDATGLSELESHMIEVFSVPQNNGQWREGTVKSSFTYLLLDPRITDNLPLRAKNMSDLEVFKTFVCSIFYIGKGKRSRPYCHLHDAVSKMNKAVTTSAKEKQIVDIWTAGLGVVSLHCFQSVIPVEAYTREACMIQAIGLHKLTNMKQGDIYGAALSWTVIQRRKLGVYLLKKALQIFLAEGERQICLPDIKGR